MSATVTNPWESSAGATVDDGAWRWGYQGTNRKRVTVSLSRVPGSVFEKNARLEKLLGEAEAKLATERDLSEKATQLSGEYIDRGQLRIAQLEADIKAEVAVSKKRYEDCVQKDKTIADLRKLTADVARLDKDLRDASSQARYYARRLDEEKKIARDNRQDSYEAAAEVATLKASLSDLRDKHSKFTDKTLGRMRKIERIANGKDDL